MRLMKAWRERMSLGDDCVESVQRCFLPGALEVQDTPPSPVGRWLLWTLLTLFSLGLVWAMLGEVDIVVTAPGRIVPSGQVKVVQSPDVAVVSSIHVQNGQRVVAGALLISLDSTAAEADDLRVSEKILSGARELAWRLRLEAWLADEDRGVDEDRPSKRSTASTPSQRGAGKRVDLILQQRQAEISARLLGLEEDLQANDSERQSVAAELDRAQSRLAIVKERVLAYSTLVEKQYGARVQYLEMLERETDLEKSIPVLHARNEQLVNQAQAVAAKRIAAASEIRAANLLEIEQLEAELAMLEQESRKAGQLRMRQVLRAPVTGTVQELAVHTAGAVTTPAQAILKIVPEAAVLEVEAFLQNKDIGFVHAGQVAQVKVDSFNFTKYGLIDAEVSAISNDAMEDNSRGWVFKMRLQLAADEIQVAGKPVKLSPGMSVVTEIKTGKRRLIEFFLSPLLRYRQESVRER